MNLNTDNISPEHQQLIARLCQLETDKLSNTITISVVGAGGKTHLCFWLATLLKQLGHKVCLTTTTKMFQPDATYLDKIITLATEDEADTLSNTEQLKALPTKQISAHNNDITFIYNAEFSTSDNQTDTQSTQTISKVNGLSYQTIKQLKNSRLFSVIIIEADGARHKAIKAPARHEPCVPNESDIVIGVTGAETIFSQANCEKVHRWTEFSQLTHCSENMLIDENILTLLVNSPKGLFKNAPEQATKIWVINKYDLSLKPEALLTLAENILNRVPKLSSVWLTQLNSSEAIKTLLVKG